MVIGKNSTTCKSWQSQQRVISELYKKHGKDKPKLGSTMSYL